MQLANANECSVYLVVAYVLLFFTKSHQIFHTVQTIKQALRAFADNLHILCTWTSKGGQGPLEILAKKVVFLVSGGKKQI